MQAIWGGHKQVQRLLLVLSKIASRNLWRWRHQHEKPSKSNAIHCNIPAMNTTFVMFLVFYFC